LSEPNKAGCPMMDKKEGASESSPPIAVPK
jgi:hypothetical protein